MYVGLYREMIMFMEYYDPRLDWYSIILVGRFISGTGCQALGSIFIVQSHLLPIDGCYWFLWKLGFMVYASHLCVSLWLLMIPLVCTFSLVAFWQLVGTLSMS